MADGKEIVWLPKELAEKVKALDDGRVQNALIEEYFENSKGDIKALVESFDYYTIEYRALMSKAQRAFKDASDSMLKKSEDIWESFDEKMPYLEDKIKDITDKLEPITKELDKIEGRINKVPSSYLFREILELIERLANADEKTLKLFDFLVDNYTKEEQE